MLTWMVGLDQTRAEVRWSLDQVVILARIARKQNDNTGQTIVRPNEPHQTNCFNTNASNAVWLAFYARVGRKKENSSQFQLAV